MLTVGVCERGIPIVPERESGPSAPTTERGKVIAFLTPPPPTVTGNPVIDRWIAEGRLLPAAVPGTVLDLLPPPGAPVGAGSLADAVIAERDREAGDG